MDARRLTAAVLAATILALPGCGGGSFLFDRTPGQTTLRVFWDPATGETAIATPGSEPVGSLLLRVAPEPPISPGVWSETGVVPVELVPAGPDEPGVLYGCDAARPRTP